MLLDFTNEWRHTLRTAHIQAVATEEKHPELVKWWNDKKGDKSATVRIALDWFLFGFRPQMDRIERLLEVLVEEAKK